MAVRTFVEAGKIGDKVRLADRILGSVVRHQRERAVEEDQALRVSTQAQGAGHCVARGGHLCVWVGGRAVTCTTATMQGEYIILPCHVIRRFT